MGSVLVAATAGFLTSSWTIFWIALVVLVAFNLHAGEIRPGPR